MLIKIREGAIKSLRSYENLSYSVENYRWNDLTFNIYHFDTLREAGTFAADIAAIVKAEVRVERNNGKYGDSRGQTFFVTLRHTYIRGEYYVREMKIPRSVWSK